MKQCIVSFLSLPSCISVLADLSLGVHCKNCQQAVAHRKEELRLTYDTSVVLEVEVDTILSSPCLALADDNCGVN